MKPRQRSEGCSLSQLAITKATGQVLLTKASASYSTPLLRLRSLLCGVFPIFKSISLFQIYG